MKIELNSLKKEDRKKPNQLMLSKRKETKTKTKKNVP